MNEVLDIIKNPMALPIALPLVAGLVCRLLPRSWSRVQGLITVAMTAVTALLAWKVFAAGSAMLGDGRWFMVDGLSRFVLLAIAAYGFLIALYSLGFMRDRPRCREYYSALLFTVGISCGAVMANDLILLLVCWGLLGLTLFVMIGVAGPEASAAAKKSFIVIGGSDCFLMLGIVITWLLTRTTRMDAITMAFTGELTIVAFLCFAAAAFAKAGAFPLHTWVPDCGEKALAPVAAFLPASLDKLLGIYLLARCVNGLFEMNATMHFMLMAVGAVTVIAGVMMALVQHDLKRLLSYHAVSQVGYMVMGIGTGTLIGLAGGLFHMLNNTIYKTALFLCAGSVEQKAGTTDLDRLGGLARLMPVTFGTCFVAALAISGIPPLNGFTSKWMVYQGIVESGKAGGHAWIIWLTAAMIGSALTLASFVKVLHAVYLCKAPAGRDDTNIREVSPAMQVPMAILAALCVVFGVLAFRLPLKYLIFPALGGEVPVSGDWWAGSATIMMGAALLVGLIVYWITGVRKMRECETYIGGEIMTESVPSDASGNPEHVELSGVGFYKTIEEMGGLRTVYAAAQKKLFDVYDVGTKGLFYFVEALRKAHTGVLPLYLTWVLVGLLALVWLLRQG
ncbi:MAG: NADH-quinone oxidoreductase subunit L [Lentisphaerae bacterium]|nr:NADH-quinone oxidoreductase subunit L [Lentisphaerota bacterium]